MVSVLSQDIGQSRPWNKRLYLFNSTEPLFKKCLYVLLGTLAALLVIGSVLEVVKRQRVQSFNLNRKGKTKWYFCQCSKVEYKEVLILLARTGGLGWSGKDCGYAFRIFNVERCELKSILVALALDQSFFLWDRNVDFIVAAWLVVVIQPTDGGMRSLFPRGSFEFSHSAVFCALVIIIILIIEDLHPHWCLSKKGNGRF